VAEDAGAVVGTIWVGLIEKLPNPTPEPEEHAYVTNVYVRPAARGAGTGSALLRAALAWCEARGVHAVVLWPTARSTPLYRRHGFDTPAALLERELAPGPDRGATAHE
jgi:GNAT superfamily N-acetyltransferase